MRSWVNCPTFAGAALAAAQHQHGRVAANAVSFEAPQTSGMRPCRRCQLRESPHQRLCLYM